MKGKITLETPGGRLSLGPRAMLQVRSSKTEAPYELKASEIKTRLSNGVPSEILLTPELLKEHGLKGPSDWVSVSLIAAKRSGASPGRQERAERGLSQTIGVSLSPEENDRLKALAELWGIAPSRVVARLLMEANATKT